LRCANKTKTFSTSFKDAPNRHQLRNDADNHLNHDHHHEEIFLRHNSKKKDMMMAFPIYGALELGRVRSQNNWVVFNYLLTLDLECCGQVFLITKVSF